MLNLVFMGTAAFAVPSLRALAGAGHRLRAVVTQPDRPRGRGLRPRASPVKEAALELGLPLLQPEKARDPAFVEALRALEPQLIVVVAYGQILRPAVLELPPLGCVNLHASLLPELRGAAPVAWAILRGYRETGVTTMFMDEGMDTGDLILAEPEPIAPDDTAGSLGERLALRGAALLQRTAALVAAGEAPRVAQEHDRATYAPKLKPEDGAVSWEEDAAASRNRIHGCNPVPGAFAFHGGRRIKIWRARVVEGAGPEGTQAGQPAPPSQAGKPAPLPGQPAPPSQAGKPAPPGGTVLAVREEGPVLAAGSGGALLLLELQAEGKARLSGGEFARGYRVQPGDRWEGGQPAAPRA